jgi:signal peptidase
MKKIYKTIYCVFLGIMAIILFVLISSALPISSGIKTFVVQSGSMEPAIKTGSVAVVSPMDNYAVGDIITFGENKGKILPTTHRIVESRAIDGKIIYKTKGDANNGPDMMEISKSSIIGKVILSIPYLGYIIAFAKKPIGFIIIIGVPAVAIIYDEAIKIWKEMKKMREKNKQNDEA